MQHKTHSGIQFYKSAKERLMRMKKKSYIQSVRGMTQEK
jgi:hypothetical protein